MQQQPTHTTFTSQTQQETHVGETYLLNVVRNNRGGCCQIFSSAYCYTHTHMQRALCENKVNGKTAVCTAGAISHQSEIRCGSREARDWILQDGIYGGAKGKMRQVRGVGEESEEGSMEDVSLPTLTFFLETLLSHDEKPLDKPNLSEK